MTPQAPEQTPKAGIDYLSGEIDLEWISVAQGAPCYESSVLEQQTPGPPGGDLREGWHVLSEGAGKKGHEMMPEPGQFPRPAEHTKGCPLSLIGTSILAGAVERCGLSKLGRRRVKTPGETLSAREKEQLVEGRGEAESRALPH